MIQNGDDYAREQDGPIIQPILDYLMVDDYIEITGDCFGPKVTIELLADVQIAAHDANVLPLRVQLTADGPVVVTNQAGGKVQRQEETVRDGMRINRRFELCIYAEKDGFQIKLNKEFVCRQKYLTNLEDVVAISLDGDAEFNSIEFHDLLSDKNASFDKDTDQPGFMRIQEKRESGSRRPGSSQLIRNSTIRSNRSSSFKSPTATPSIERKNSMEYARKRLDIDSPTTPRSTYQRTNDDNGSIGQFGMDYGAAQRNTQEIIRSGDPKSNLSPIDNSIVLGGTRSATLPDYLNQDTHQQIDNDRGIIYRPPTKASTVESPSLTPTTEKNKNRFSNMFSRNKKPKVTENEMGSHESDKATKRKGIISFFKGKSKGSSSSTDTWKKHRSSPDLYDAEQNRIPKHLAKDSASQIAAYLANRKSSTEYERFSLTESAFRPPSYSEFDEMSKISSYEVKTSATHSKYYRGSTDLSPEIDLRRDVDRIAQSTSEQGTIIAPRQKYDSLMLEQPPKRSQAPYADRRLNRYDMDDTSTVHSDGEFYLEVGRSQYYLDRKESLAKYMPKSTHRKGQNWNRLSPSSSVSSLDQSELGTLMANSERLMFSDKSPRDKSTMGFRETYQPFEASPSRRIVYAAPKCVQPQHSIIRNVSKDELRFNGYAASFPVMLSAGRYAKIEGHFTPKVAEPKVCVIHLKVDENPNNSRCCSLILEIHSDGKLDVFAVNHNEKFLLANWNGTSDLFVDKFSLELHSREIYSALTIPEVVSLKLPIVVDACALKYIQLESCMNSVLDQFSISKELLTPLTLICPKEIQHVDEQTLSLETKFNADSKYFLVEFYTQSGVSYKFLIDFVLDYAHVQSSSGDTVMHREDSIPFVPEQIRQLCILQHVNEARLKVTANNKEIFNQLIGNTITLGKLSQVCISGDVSLTEAEFS